MLNIKESLRKLQDRMQLIWDKIQNHKPKCDCATCERFRDLEENRERPLLHSVRQAYGYRSSRWCHECLRHDDLVETENGGGLCNKCLAKAVVKARGDAGSSTPWIPSQSSN